MTPWGSVVGGRRFHRQEVAFSWIDAPTRSCCTTVGPHHLDLGGLMEQDCRPSTGVTRGASAIDPRTRAATFEACRPALEALFSAAGNDPRLSAQAHRVLRAVIRTGPRATLATADLAARASTPKTRVWAALAELEAHGYLARLTDIAPHLAAALPASTPPRNTDPA